MNKEWIVKLIDAYSSSHQGNPWNFPSPTERAEIITIFLHFKNSTQVSTAQGKEHKLPSTTLNF